MRRWLGLTGSLALALFGCGEKARPWSGSEGTPAILAPPVRGDSKDSPNAVGSAAPGDTNGPGANAPSPASPAPSAAPVADEAPEGAPEGPRVTPGGNWVKCSEGLVLSGDPLKDVTRIGVMCGPSNGMRRKTKQALVGVIGEGQPPVVSEVKVQRGACYRVLAAADAGVAELEVTVRSSHDVAVAADHSLGRLAVVQVDRPFCTFADDTLSIEISAKRGSGRFAAELWALGERKKKGDPDGAPPDEPPLDRP